jgi:nitrite reductase/ring-hydroxylating ferredoxin subunit
MRENSLRMQPLEKNETELVYIYEVVKGAESMAAHVTLPERYAAEVRHSAVVTPGHATPDARAKYACQSHGQSHSLTHGASHAPPTSNGNRTTPLREEEARAQEKEAIAGFAEPACQRH